MLIMWIIKVCSLFVMVTGVFAFFAFPLLGQTLTDD